MRVFRLEKLVSVGRQEKLIGPWTASCYQKDLDDVTWRYKVTLPGPCPEPHEDGIKGFVSNFDQVCGWYNRMGIISWCRWKDVTEALQAVGFMLNVYDVPDDKVLLGKTQCVWIPKYATLIGSITYDDMIDQLTYQKRR